VVVEGILHAGGGSSANRDEGGDTLVVAVVAEAGNMHRVVDPAA